MTYRAYIKKDYKPEIRWVADRPRYARVFPLLTVALGIVLALTGFVLYDGDKALARTSSQPVLSSSIKLPSPPSLPTPEESEALTESESVPLANLVEPEQSPAKAKVDTQNWQSVVVKKGDSLSMIFNRLSLSPRLLYRIMHSSDDASILKELLPGQRLDFLIEEGEFRALRFEPELTRMLEVSKSGDKISSNIIMTELEYRNKQAIGSIDSSLFLAGQRAGLSDRLIMQMVSIFGWDIDFALDIREGDEFKVIFQEQFKDGVKVGDGPILAAAFTNRKESYRALRYTSPEGETNYFNENGISMRKAFLRTPLKFSRISSGFNLRRKHPVLNRIRAHKGVDYAAPTGTPIKATGDGTVTLAGRKGGYGRTVILKHGGTRSTLYAHMSSISKNTRKGQRVKQGQIIGYVGKSGLATGPHLHYEFRVNGVHRNPLTVKFPNASGVPNKYRADFKEKTAAHLALLNQQGSTRLADNNNKESNIIALDETRPATHSVH